MTITAFPDDYPSVQGDLIYTVHDSHADDPGTYPNYKYIGDVYVGATQVARIKKVPDPVYNYGIFNVGQIVRNYMTTIFKPGTDLLSQKLGNGEFSLSVTMKFGEEYSYTSYTNILEDTPRMFFNHYNTRPGNASVLEDFIDKPLTSRPYATTIRCDSKYNFIPFLPSTTDEFSITIKTYDFSNSLIATLAVPYTPDSAFQLFIFSFSKAAINIYGDYIVEGVKYFTVEFPGSIIYRFNIDCECMYEVFTLHFLNKYGGFESKDFAKVSRKTISIEKKDFGKLPYTVDSSGVVSYKNGNVYNETRSVYSSQFKEKMTLNSDLLTDAEYRWLQELVVSPMVYLEEDGSFYPVVITETNYEPKKIVNDDLTNLTIGIEFGTTENAQFR